MDAASSSGQGGPPAAPSPSAGSRAPDGISRRWGSLLVHAVRSSDLARRGAEAGGGGYAASDRAGGRRRAQEAEISPPLKPWEAGSRRQGGVCKGSGSGGEKEGAYRLPPPAPPPPAPPLAYTRVIAVVASRSPLPASSRAVSVVR
ncbi:hypothetical protein ZWY2020_002633 [Hordeum vulgare]|nr:hypothetical protein ZWY2020_002633 [Hordeum vulgare]